jgi:RNA polymerase sigma-70 factor (ECF subfamily)
MMDEVALITSAQNGDIDAFNSLILLYQDFLFRVAERMLGDEDNAADVLQDALVSAFRNFNSFRGGSLKPWLARIVINGCYDELRRSKRRRLIPFEQPNEDDEETGPTLWVSDPAPSPEQNSESRDLERTIAGCLQSLTPDHRVVLVLVDVEERSYVEAAAMIGIPVNTLRSRLARARINMSRQLQRFRDQLPSRYQIELCEGARAEAAF